MKTILPFFVYAFFAFACSNGDRGTAEGTHVEDSDATRSGMAERWSKEKANAWQEEKGWLVGCNFTPSTAINQLEMWQEETFDPETIDRELGWAEDLGFNSIRVYLHDLLWEQDSSGMLERMEEFLEIADKHQIGVMFVLFDGVWHPYPKSGTQPEPTPHVHNSGWVQSPGLEVLQDSTQDERLESYVKGIIRHFAQDERVHVWDIFNEPDNPNISAYGDIESKDKASLALRLLKKSFTWAREANPSQPVTSAVWRGDYSDPDNLEAMDEFMINNSDIISFHQYDGPEKFREVMTDLQQYERPLLCTEYMARGNGSTFEDILPILKENEIGAYNWGFVAGKSQTIYPWDSWTKTYTDEPGLWFHDIFRPNGEPYREDEVKLIKKMTGK
jgi:hypothetical protein